MSPAFSTALPEGCGHWEKIQIAIRGAEIQVREEILTEWSLRRVERKRQEEDAEAVYKKVDH